jgi:XTP/dITP diphosphohydrolase
MKMIYGTGNANKVEDIKAIIKEHKQNIEILSLKDINFNEDIEENGKTFEENSEIKAKAVKTFCDSNKIEYDIITTDDAGLCVNCLNGEPGIFSARYAGPNGTQEQCINKLLTNIEKTGDQERKAKFVCVLTSILKDGTKIISRGECNGTVAKEVKKLGGLTYSPVFIPDGYDVPMSELSAQEYEKAHNHREKAFVKLLNELK